MPTAAKLVAALAFAALGAAAGWLFGQEVPASARVVPFFPPVAAGIGLICGWRISGARAGGGFLAAMGTGLRTAVTLAFFALLAFSAQVVISRSMAMIYDGPLQALLAVVDLMVIHGKLALAPPVAGTLAAGGLVGGLLAEWAGRRWT